MDEWRLEGSGRKRRVAQTTGRGQVTAVKLRDAENKNTVALRIKGACTSPHNIVYVVGHAHVRFVFLFVFDTGPFGHTHTHTRPSRNKAQKVHAVVYIVSTWYDNNRTVFGAYNKIVITPSKRTRFFFPPNRW